MEWTLLRQEDYVTTRWSGGTTTQLAIAPEGAVYAGRDFLWRLSSAKVELEHSDFTPLPDYVRLISVLSGKLELKAGGGERLPLELLTAYSFEGGTPVESWGRCTDFNLMLRKGTCQGSVQSLIVHGVCRWTPAVPAPRAYPNCTLALYCAAGGVRVIPPDGGERAVQGGELLLCREADDRAPLRLESERGASIMAAAIFTN